MQESKADYHDDLEAREEAHRSYYRTLKSRTDAERGWKERLADQLTEIFGSMAFLMANAVWFVVWITLNIKIIPGLEPFDPFPFGFLTMAVSLEAIALAIIVLISQNRAAKIGDLRQEVDLQVNVLAEEQLTKALELLTQLLHYHGIDTAKDEGLQAMLEPTNIADIEAETEKEMALRPKS